MREDEGLGPVQGWAGMCLDGRYDLEEMMGEGGTGVVFRATQRSLRRTVAVKITRFNQFQLDKHDTMALERLRREVDLISELSHPNICRLLDFGQLKDLGVFYTVMEYVDGPTLGRVARRKKLAKAFAVEVFDQLCAALSEPHARGILHRDIKPDNIMLTLNVEGALQVKLVDFGLARPNTSKGSSLTITGMILGTPAYMAPEQAEARPLDGRTDLYAAGVILFEMLTGVPPFKASNSMGLMFKHTQVKPPRVGELRDDVAFTPLEDLVADLLEKDPALRPQSVVEVRTRLARARAQMGLGVPLMDASLEGEARYVEWVVPE